MLKHIKYKEQICSALIILLIVIVLPVTILAWTTYVKQKNFASYTSGEILIETKEGDHLISELIIDNLTYIDLTYDLIDDESQTLDLIATSFKITVKVKEESIPVKLEVALNLSGHSDLLYLLIYEGLSEASFTTTYKTYLVNLNIPYDENSDIITNEAIARQAITTHNQSTYEQIATQILEPGDTLAFQIVFWGDYNQFTEPVNLSTIFYDDIILIIDTVQKEKPYEEN